MSITYIEYDADSDEYYFQIPPDMIDALGWNTDDVLVWTILEDNTVILRKKKENEDE
jgi:hypothetical protein